MDEQESVLTKGRPGYRVSIIFDVYVDDTGRYPDGSEVRRALYDAVEMPGYMTQGLDITAVNAQIRAIV